MVTILLSAVDHDSIESRVPLETLLLAIHDGCDRKTFSEYRRLVSCQPSGGRELKGNE
jgi:hypothetical protein